MTEPTSRLLSTSPRLKDAAEVSRAETFPPLLLQQSVRRIRLLALIMLGLVLIIWVFKGTIDGSFFYDLGHFPQWGPPTLVLLASLVMFLAARGSRIAARTLLKLALVYEVTVSFGLGFAQYWGAFVGLRADQISGDVVSLSTVAIWMLCFAVFVPVRPRDSVIALLGSAAATPLTYAVIVRVGDAPSLAPLKFFLVFVFPYVVVAGTAYLMVRIIYGLGQEVRRARELGSYSLEERLGQGGMGEVWRAKHRMLARPAAVKLVNPVALGETSERLAETLARFEREAQITAELQSSHTVSLYDYGASEDGRLYYVMELLDGIDLEQLVQRFGPLPAERVTHVLLQVCDSLAEAHQRGLVHRDLKPGNIFLCRYALNYDVVKVLDFGLAKRIQLSGDDGAPLSRAEAIVGTPAYMAPEIALGEDVVDGRSDIYALGCVAYWLLTGCRVFDAASPTAMAVAHVREEPVPPSRRRELPTPSTLDELVMVCLAKDRDARVQTADALAEQLAAIPVAESWTQQRAAEWWALHAPGVGEQ